MLSTGMLNALAQIKKRQLIAEEDVGHAWSNRPSCIGYAIT